jgi:hypothetical protein
VDGDSWHYLIKMKSTFMNFPDVNAATDVAYAITNTDSDYGAIPHIAY